jgi:starvation-inducible DNA-binding protein
MEEETEYTLEQLVQQMKAYLASSFTTYLKAHSYHWNVEGINFHEMHAFFGEVYEQYFDSLDDIAEQIRQLDAYAPGSLSRMSSLSLVVSPDVIPDTRGMVENLRADNEAIMNLATELSDMADELELLGLENFLQDKIMGYSKLNWKLKSILA